MDNFIAIVMSVLAICMLVVIAIYNNLDRLRFRLDTMLRRANPELEDWLEACEALQPGCTREYRQTKRNWQRSACLQALVSEVTENSEDKLDAQEALLDFCYRYSQMAEKYNRKVTDPVTGGLARLLGFRPYALLDFYPDVTVPRPDGDEK